MSEVVATYGAGAASWWRVVGVAQRHWYVLRRSPHRLFDVVLWPIVDTLLFGSIAVYAASRSLTTGQQLIAYTLAGMILWQVVYQAQIALATGFLEETWSRNLLNLMATPLREWEHVAGMALFGLAKLVCGVGVVAVLAWVAYAFDVTTMGPALLPVAAILLAIGWAIALFVIGLVLRFGSGAEALAWGVLFALMPLSGVFYPVAALPGVLQPVAAVLPTTHAFAAGRVLAAGGPVPWGEVGTAAAGTLVMVVAALGFVTMMLRQFRARGFVTRYS
jgi:ABC-2 type transport system permease protein